MILGKLQQAPVRAMSDIFPNLYNALADMKRYSGILRKDFLIFSPEHPKLTFKKVHTLFSFPKYKNPRAVPNLILRQMKVYCIKQLILQQPL